MAIKMKVLLSGRGFLAVILLLCRSIVCDGQCPKIAQRPLEIRLHNATAVFRAVVVQTYPEIGIIDMAVVSIYKGGIELASVSQYAGSIYNTTDRQLTLKVRSEFKDCFEWGMPPKHELVVFAKVRDPIQDEQDEITPEVFLEATSEAVPWSVGIDFAMWTTVGWASWGEWGPCSETCGGGKQIRRRFCSKPSCEGFGKQIRTCNTFQCDGTINLLAPDSRRNFHPNRARWDSIPDRPHAYALKPNSYIWISSSELFNPEKSFPKEFTVFISLRLRPESKGNGQGTLFSLRSRRKSDSYLSLELVGRGTARIVHAREGSSKSIHMDVPLYNLRWHNVAISVHDDNTVRMYVDCKWLRTDVLEKDALVTPKDADLIIGYLFSGDLEQLTIAPRASEASQQCSSQITETTLDYENIHQ